MSIKHAAHHADVADKMDIVYVYVNTYINGRDLWQCQCQEMKKKGIVEIHKSHVLNGMELN